MQTSETYVEYKLIRKQTKPLVRQEIPENRMGEPQISGVVAIIHLRFHLWFRLEVEFLFPHSFSVERFSPLTWLTSWVTVLFILLLKKPHTIFGKTSSNFFCENFLTPQWSKFTKKIIKISFSFGWVLGQKDGGKMFLKDLLS